jgi:hypothetical protein
MPSGVNCHRRYIDRTEVLDPHSRMYLRIATGMTSAAQYRYAQGVCERGFGAAPSIMDRATHDLLVRAC